MGLSFFRAKAMAPCPLSLVSRPRADPRTAGSSEREEQMKLRWCLVLASALALPASGAMANEELIKLEQDANQWVMPTQNYANTRYSTLNQINKDNVKDLHPVWTFSTGVLRGHEGSPLVIGDVMYLTTPFPNIVY